MSEETESRAIHGYGLFTIQDDQNNRLITFATTGILSLYDNFRDEVVQVDLNTMWNFNELAKLIRGLKGSMKDE